jgi:hypothetical protein
MGAVACPIDPGMGSQPTIQFQPASIFFDFVAYDIARRNRPENLPLGCFFCFPCVGFNSTNGVV